MFYRRLFSVAVVLALIILLVAGACAAQKVPQQVPTDSASEPPGSSLGVPSTVPQEFSKVWESWRLLKEGHVRQQELNADELSRAAIRGMIEALDDPHATYLTPEQYRLEIDELRGEFGGVGMMVTIRNNRLTVITPLPGTPAERVGIRAGDILLAIDGESAIGMTLNQSALIVRGLIGTTVELTVRHIDPPTTEKFAIVRERINVSNVELEMKEGGIAHVIIRTFADNTDEELGELLKKLNMEGVRGIVLDLRNNPRGIVETGVNVASQFIDGGLVRYSIDGKDQRRDLTIRPGDILIDTSVVVLVNQFSASTSEVLAGALQSHGRAIVVGTQTRGKGSVNALHKLSDGSGILFSIARSFTPDGQVIEGKGITPDVVVSQGGRSGEDPQLSRALEILRESIASLP